MKEIDQLSRLITEHQQVARVLRESEERYRNLVENARNIIYTLSEEGKCISLNPEQLYYRTIYL